MMSRSEVQAAAAVLMIQPRAFGSNAQTRPSNAFQSHCSEDEAGLIELAQREFQALVQVLRDQGVQVHVFPGRSEHDAPDEVFPNNWFSTHGDGTIVLYPLLAENRRLERRGEILEALNCELGYHTRRVIDLTSHETRGHYLEGTGSLVLDRVNRFAYANSSARTHLEALGDFSQQLDYDVVAFEAMDENGTPIYHTNVMMSVGSSFAAICPEVIRDETKRAAVLKRLSAGGREIIELTSGQLRAFSGNMLELTTPSGPIIVLSSGADQALDDQQRSALANHGRLVTAAVPTIERIGGGGVRCMLAEIHLPG